MTRISDNSYTEYEKRCLISLWHIMIQCKRRSVGCDNCDIKRFCADLDATYKWLEKKYGED